MRSDNGDGHRDGRLANYCHTGKAYGQIAADPWLCRADHRSDRHRDRQSFRNADFDDAYDYDFDHGCRRNQKVERHKMERGWKNCVRVGFDAAYFRRNRLRYSAPLTGVRNALSARSMRKLVAEFIGTFALVFAGTGAIVINDVSQGAITHVGIALTFGLIVLAMIYTLGDISGAHLNPAVTLGFFAARRFEQRLAGPYL